MPHEKESAGVGHRGRKKNIELLKEYRKDYCQLCSKSGLLDNHHIFAKGSGGPDEKWNLITLCRDCHNAFHNGKVERIKLLAIKIKQLKHEEESEEEIEKLLEYASQKLIAEEYDYLLVKAGKLPVRVGKNGE